MKKIKLHHVAKCKKKFPTLNIYVINNMCLFNLSEHFALRETNKK